MDVAIVASGGHGREIFQVVHAAIRAGADLRFVGFFDDAPQLDLIERLGSTHLGSVADARGFDGGCYLGLGSGALKQRLGEGVPAAPPLVHPLADVGTDVELAPGAVVFAQATVTTNIQLGSHVHIGRGAAVGHDSTLADWSSVMPLASISGNVTLGERAFVGTGALLRQGVSVGADATVGMGAVVLRDVESGQTVVGNPARAKG